MALKDEFTPRYENGDVKVLGPFINLIASIIAGAFTAVFTGIAAIPASIAEMVSNPIESLASFLSDFVSELFGLTGYVWTATQGVKLGFGEIGLEEFGILAYPVVMLLLAGTLWLLVWTVEQVGVLGDG